jgi:hypothetical protein
MYPTYFICLNCNVEYKIESKINDRRITRKKYCVKCLPPGVNASKFAIRDGDECVCKYCDKSFIYRSRGKTTTTRCSACKWKQYHQRAKEKAVKAKGGKCQICGYQKHIGALAFHHLDSTQKEHNFNNISWTRMKKELNKCILVCFNCHQEIHGNIINIPKRVLNSTKSNRRK